MIFSRLFRLELNTYRRRVRRPLIVSFVVNVPLKYCIKSIQISSSHLIAICETGRAVATYEFRWCIDHCLIVIIAFIIFQSRLSHLLHEKEGSERLNGSEQDNKQIWSAVVVVISKNLNPTGLSIRISYSAFLCYFTQIKVIIAVLFSGFKNKVPYFDTGFYRISMLRLSRVIYITTINVVSGINGTWNDEVMSSISKRVKSNNICNVNQTITLLISMGFDLPVYIKSENCYLFMYTCQLQTLLP